MLFFLIKEYFLIKYGNKVLEHRLLDNDICRVSRNVHRLWHLLISDIIGKITIEKTFKI